MRPLRRRDVRVELSAQASFGGSATAPEVRGTLTVNQGLVLLNNLEVGGITTLPISTATPAWAKAGYEPPTSRRPAGQKACRYYSLICGGTGAATCRLASGGTPGLFDLRIVIPGRFVVEGFGLKANGVQTCTLAARPPIRWLPPAQRSQGQLGYSGKNFKLARGAVTFGGGMFNPLLDIMLTSQTPAPHCQHQHCGTVRKNGSRTEQRPRNAAR